MKTIIHPTHHCFDDALGYLDLLAQERNPALHAMVLVHGICLHPDDDRPFAHAWVETAYNKVIDAGLINGTHVYYEIPREDHYAKLRVQDTTKYTPLQACQENRKDGTSGPCIKANWMGVTLWKNIKSESSTRRLNWTRRLSPLPHLSPAGFSKLSQVRSVVGSAINWKP